MPLQGVSKLDHITQADDLRFVSPYRAKIWVFSGCKPANSPRQRLVLICNFDFAL